MYPLPPKGNWYPKVFCGTWFLHWICVPQVSLLYESGDVLPKLPLAVYPCTPVSNHPIYSVTVSFAVWTQYPLLNSSKSPLMTKFFGLWAETMPKRRNPTDGIQNHFISKPPEHLYSGGNLYLNYCITIFPCCTSAPSMYKRYKYIPVFKSGLETCQTPSA